MKSHDGVNLPSSPSSSREEKKNRNKKEVVLETNEKNLPIYASSRRVDPKICIFFSLLIGGWISPNRYVNPRPHLPCHVSKPWFFKLSFVFERELGSEGKSSGFGVRTRNIQKQRDTSSRPLNSLRLAPLPPFLFPFPFSIHVRTRLIGIVRVHSVLVRVIEVRNQE